MIFNPDPTEQEKQTWGDFAYLSEESRKAVLAVPFGKYKKAEKEAKKFVKRQRIYHALKSGKRDALVAARALGVSEAELKKDMKTLGIINGGVVWGSE